MSNGPDVAVVDAAVEAAVKDFVEANGAESPVFDEGRFWDALTPLCLQLQVHPDDFQWSVAKAVERLYARA